MENHFFLRESLKRGLDQPACRRAISLESTVGHRGLNSTTFGKWPKSVTSDLAGVAQEVGPCPLQVLLHRAADWAH